jgi:hypothetical protein
VDKNHLVFNCLAKKKKKTWLNICALFFVYSQIWQNIPRDGFLIFCCIFLWMIATLAMNRYSFFKKTHWPGAITAGEVLWSQNLSCAKMWHELMWL